MVGSHLEDGARSVGVLPGTYFLCGALLNWVILLRGIVTRKRQPSLAPLPGVAGAVAVLISFPAWRRYAWVPLLLDPSSVAFLAYALPVLVAETWRYSRINLMSRYVARPDARRTVTLSLYKKGFLLQQDFRQAPREPGLLGAHTPGRWREMPGQIVLQFGEKQAVFSKEGGGLRHALGDLYEQNPELSLTGLVFERVP